MKMMIKKRHSKKKELNKCYVTLYYFITKLFKIFDIL